MKKVDRNDWEKREETARFHLPRLGPRGAELGTWTVFSGHPSPDFVIFRVRFLLVSRPVVPQLLHNVWETGQGTRWRDTKKMGVTIRGAHLDGKRTRADSYDEIKRWQAGKRRLNGAGTGKLTKNWRIQFQKQQKQRGVTSILLGSTKKMIDQILKCSNWSGSCRSSKTRSERWWRLGIRRMNEFGGYLFKNSIISC